MTAVANDLRQDRTGDSADIVAGKVAQLRAIIAAAAQGDSLGANGPLLAAWLERFVGGENLEQAIGLPTRGTPWRKLAALAERNALIVSLAQEFFPGQSARTASRAIADALKRYGATSWPRERVLSTPRPAATGTPSELFWRIYRTGQVVSRPRSIERILLG